MGRSQKDRIKREINLLETMKKKIHKLLFMRKVELWRLHMKKNKESYAKR